MTTYSHTITLNDSERIALEKALVFMIEHCDAQLKDGPKAPYARHKMICQEIWTKLITSTRHMTSTSSACWPRRTP